MVVFTAPEEIPGEAELLEGLLEAGLEKLHLRKPGGSVAGLVERLAPRWSSRLVVHGMTSRSVHSWEEFMRLPAGLDYAFISPVFNSISKPGYMANGDLLRMPAGPYPCRPVGLGGVRAENIGQMLGCGWTGAALLGWIWEVPGEAVSRFVQIKTITDGQAKGIGGGGI